MNLVGKEPESIALGSQESQGTKRCLPHGLPDAFPYQALQNKGAALGGSEVGRTDLIGHSGRLVHWLPQQDSEARFSAVADVQQPPGTRDGGQR